MVLFCNCNSLFSSINFPELFIGGILGAFLGLLISNLFQLFRNWWFCRKNLKPLIGKYKVTLKSGNEYTPASKVMNIIKTKGKKLNIENDDIEKGEILFQSANYGRGWYKTKGNNTYGFYELIVLHDKKIAALRKFTTDNDKGQESFNSVETSFIWDRI